MTPSFQENGEPAKHSHLFLSVAEKPLGFILHDLTALSILKLLASSQDVSSHPTSALLGQEGRVDVTVEKLTTGKDSAGRQRYGLSQLPAWLWEKRAGHGHLVGHGFPLENMHSPCSQACSDPVLAFPGSDSSLNLRKVSSAVGS